jgi:HSP20 family protein
MAPSGWDPFRELAGLQERLDSMFRDIDRTRREEHFMASHWTPPVDIYEAGDSFILKLELPEVSKDSIDLRVEENELTITGERSIEPGTSGEQYLRMERGYGTFTRSFNLTKAIDVSNIKATIKDGILRVELPKKGETPPKQIIIEIE